jgi:serine/threonine-protein kinase
MESAPRYEILDTIATGDFAKVFRARDRELGREVAIKQIHQQFLGNPRQLERYWREAQLLATLQHPNIVTIYDVVRSRGWLILELMRGNLQRSAETGPIDLDYLRASLIGCLSALGFLHTNGVIHGDVKPSNMLVDAQGRIKLGDFGLARRASSEQGSLLKGTTKYMAPELASDQFGPMGPASDLYSLGFSAYELMCGPQFDSLFPGLATFGRDRQIAWLMWHSAPDRNLPEIARVLEGVPEDLARVIQRLTIKDQARRYHSAQSALRDLRASPAALGAAEEKLGGEVLPASDRQKRMVRMAAIGGLVFSAVLSMAVLFWPGKKEKAAVAEQAPVQGVIAHVYLKDQSIEIEDDESQRPVSIKLREGVDAVFINQKQSLPRHLQVADRVRVEYQTHQSGRTIAVVHAARPETQEGRIRSIDAASRQFTLAVRPGDDLVDVRVPESLEKEKDKFLINGKDTLGGKPVKLADLQTSDQVTVKHILDETRPEGDRRLATELAVLREVTSEGILRKVSKTELILETADGKRESWPFRERAAIWVNKGNTANQRALAPLDLLAGDKARVTHDTHVVRVDAERTIRQSGMVLAVQPKMVEVRLGPTDKPIAFLTDAQTKVTLAGEPAEVTDLHPGDLADVTQSSPLDSPNPLVLTLTAQRPPVQTRWAILIGIQKYDDAKLSGLTTPVADAKLLREMLVKRYGVPPIRALLLEDVSLVRLKEAIPGLLDQVPAEGSVIVYFGGHALRDYDGKVYLAPKEFNREQPAATGLSLQWLVDRMEQCKAKEKLLLLDACQATPGSDPQKEPSTAEMFQSLVAPAGRAALRTVTGMASCSEGQRGHVLADGQHGLFASSLAQGFSGGGDKNRDGRLEPTELFAFLGESMAASAKKIQQAQTAKLFPPDNRPPRLSEEAKQAIRELAAYLQQDTLNLAEAKLRFGAADAAAGEEPEAKLIYGLLLLRVRQRDDAQREFATLKSKHPDLLLPGQALAWVQFDKRAYSNGVGELADMTAKIPTPKKPGETYPADSQQLFQWIGQLREFAAALGDNRTAAQEAIQKLDAAVAGHGDAAVERYEKGRAQSGLVIKDFDDQIRAASDESRKSTLERERRQISRYADFPFAASAKAVLDGMNR